MARSNFGGTPGDFLAVVGPGGMLRAVPGTLTLWSAETGGTQHTDLRLAGTPVTTIPVSHDGQVPAFQGPDGVSVVWADAGGSQRVRLLSDKTGAELASDSFIATVLGDTGSSSFAALTGAGGAVAVAVEEQVEGHVPGTDLGTVQRGSNATSTTTAATDAAGDITGLSVTVVGQGRPVDIRFHAPGVYHSVANTLVSVILMCNGEVVGLNNQIGTENSPLTNNGPSMSISRRTGILTFGTNYTFSVRLWGNAAGTSTLVGAAFCPIELAVTSR